MRTFIASLLCRIETYLGNIVLNKLIGHLFDGKTLLCLVDGILDFLEDYAERTETKWDDAILRKIREALKVPDND